jgi:hypothetical protein
VDRRSFCAVMTISSRSRGLARSVCFQWRLWTGRGIPLTSRFDSWSLLVRHTADVAGGPASNELPQIRVAGVGGCPHSLTRCSPPLIGQPLGPVGLSLCFSDSRRIPVARVVFPSINTSAVVLETPSVLFVQQEPPPAGLTVTHVQFLSGRWGREDPSRRWENDHGFRLGAQLPHVRARRLGV